MYRHWRKFDIPAMRHRPPGRGHKLLDREQALTMVAFLAEHGADATAKRFDVARGTVYATLRRHKIPPPIGKGHHLRSRR